MALTPLRWFAIAVGGALVVTTMLIPDRPDRRFRDARMELASRERRASYRASRAADRLRALQVIDSVTRVVATLPRTDTSRFLLGAFANDTTRRYFADMVRRAALLRPARPRVPVDLVVVLDSSARVLGAARGTGDYSMGDYVLPASTGERCVAIVRLRSQVGYHSSTAAQLNAERVLGPCAFYEMYGIPGPDVDAWLRSGGWTFGRVTRMGTSRAIFFRDPAGDQSVWVRQWMSAGGFRCITGDVAMCETLLATRGDRSFPQTMVRTRPDVVSVTSFNRWMNWRSNVFGPVESELLADMAEHLGPDRFSRFWTSARPMPEAFREASGAGLGEWMLGWAEREYGPLRRGPGVPGTAVMFAFGLVAASAAGAGVAARRRQVR